jgi:hypothetical protein
MGKSRRRDSRSFFEDEDDYSYNQNKKRIKDDINRRKMKKLKNALRSNDHNQFVDDEG